jgi:hypothetical protein
MRMRMRMMQVSGRVCCVYRAWLHVCFLQHRVEVTHGAGTVVRTVFELHTHTVDSRYTRGHAEDFHAASDAQRASWRSVKRLKRLMGTGQTASCKGGCCIEASSVESTRGSRDGSMHSLYSGTREPWNSVEVVRESRRSDVKRRGGEDAPFSGEQDSDGESNNNNT